jgi:ATP-dependent helicase/nuclease subunit A
MSKRLRDQPARTRIATDLQTTFLVEAGAGSGKTTCLVTRMVALVTSGTARVEQIAAVTFTRKAAAELRERFQEALEQAARGTGGEADRAREALQHLGETALGTIHAFCARLLRERPIEAGLDPAFQEVEEADAERLLGRAWQDYLEQARATGDPAGAALARLGIAPAALQDLFTTMSRFRDAAPAADDVPLPDLGPARQALLRFLDRLAKVVPSVEPAKGRDGLQDAYRFAQWRRRVFGFESGPEMIVVLERFVGATVTLNRWPEEADPKTLRDVDLPQFVEQTVTPSVTAWREHCYGPCIRFAAGAVHYAEARRHTQGVLDFGDLLSRARDLLRDHTEVRRAFALRYQHLLVDEFQDTDPIQAEILFYLTGDAPQTGGPWHTWSLRPGALFVVGDPRQSIYRFRRADIDTYTQVKRAIAASGGEVLTLSTNFRSVDAIGRFVDAAFTGVFPTRATPVQAAFVPLATNRPGPMQHAGVRRLVLPPSGTTKGAIAETDAALVASVIAWALQGNVQVEDQDTLRVARPRDVMVLSQKREFLEGMARELEARQIPYDLTGAGGFGDDPGVAAMLTLLGALADPDNPVLVVAVLTGPLFGYSDQDLYDFTQTGGRFTFLAKPPEADPVPVGIPRALGRLHDLWRLTLDRSPAAAVAGILEAVGILPLAAASPLGAAAGGKLAKLVVLLEGAAGTEIADFPSAVDWLVEAAAGEVEAFSLLTGTRDVVRVLNLHRAKGLEAPIVFLAAPWGASDHDPEFHVDRTATGKATGYFVVREKAERAGRILAQPPGWEAKAKEEARYLAAERDRLRYVAATRAKQLLIVTESPKTNKNPWAPLLPHIPEAFSLTGIPRESAARKAIAVDPEGCTSALHSRDQALTAAAIPSVQRVAVTELVKAAGITPPRSKAGKGRAFGTVVHRCLEAAGQRIPLSRELVASFLVEAERPADEAQGILDVVTSVLKSDLWRRVQASAEAYWEVPFAFRTDGADIGTPTGPTVLEGVIDLVFREADRWILVDYKTDHIDGDVQPYVDAYAPQLRLYGKAWQAFSGHFADEMLLFFTHPKLIRSVQPI